MSEKAIVFQKYLLEGYTQTRAAIMAGINPKATTYYINRYKLKVINKYGIYKVNDDYFDIIDSEIKAYLLGFFLADGYIEKNRVRLNNSIDDLKIVELFRKEITPESKLMFSNKQKGAQFRKEQVTASLISKHMVETLREKYNIVQNKTKNYTFSFDFNTIPNHLYRHFIRGYFDGDGSVSFHKNKHRTIFFSFSFVFNSKAFTEQIANIFKGMFGITPVIYHCKGKTSDWYALRFNYNGKRLEKIKEIYQYLYKDSTVYLERKRIKFDDYIEYRANTIDNTIVQCNA